MGRLLYRGAEADIVAGSWQGLDAVYKVRRPLKYRLSVLDEAIRHQRTVHEAQMMRAAREAGLDVPRLFYVGPREATLVMELMPGRRLKDLVGEGLPSIEVLHLFRSLGRDVATLHAAGIMHGDLTTANVMARDRRLAFLDFGLAAHTARVEDHAVDLRLIKETIEGAHPAAAPPALKSLLEGYASSAGAKRARAVAGQLRAIERRGRYARVV